MGGKGSTPAPPSNYGSCVKARTPGENRFNIYWGEHVGGNLLSAQVVGMGDIARKHVHVGVFFEGPGAKGVLVECQPSAEVPGPTFSVDWFPCENGATNNIVERWSQSRFFQGCEVWSATSEKVICSVNPVVVEGLMDNEFQLPFGIGDMDPAGPLPHDKTNCVVFAVKIMLAAFNKDTAWCKTQWTKPKIGKRIQC